MNIIEVLVYYESNELQDMWIIGFIGNISLASYPQGIGESLSETFEMNYENHINDNDLNGHYRVVFEITGNDPIIKSIEREEYTKRTANSEL